MNEEFLLSKINQLELKVFELENKIKDLEGKLPKSNTEINSETNEGINKRMGRYKFEGMVYKKNRLVLAVIKKYVVQHPNINLKDLKDAFPSYAIKLSTFSIVEDLDKIPSNHKEPVKRYFLDSDDLIKLSDGTLIAVCNQWGSNFDAFLKHAEKLNFIIEPIKD